MILYVLIGVRQTDVNPAREFTVNPVIIILTFFQKCIAVFVIKIYNISDQILEKEHGYGEKVKIGH